MPASILQLNTIDPRTRNRLFAWYSAKWVNGFRGQNPADAAAIGQWNDLSDAGRHLLQGTGANQPTFRLAASPNGLYPAVRFADATDIMSVAVAGAAPRPITVLAIWKNSLADDALLHNVLTFNADRIGLSLDWLTTNEFSALDDAAAISGGGNVAGDTTLWHAHAFVARESGARSLSLIDGESVTLAGQAGTNTNSDIDVGSFACDVAEVQVYRDVLPRGEIDNLLRSLVADWGLPLSTWKYQR